MFKKNLKVFNNRNCTTVNDVICNECNKDLCNSVETDTSSFRRTLFISAGVCGIVGITGALLRCFCCRSSKKLKNDVYTT